MRRLLLALAVLLLVTTLGAAWWIGPYAMAVERFEADPSAGFHAPYYLYVSPAAAASKDAVILVQPNNSGTNSDDPAPHRRDAWWTGFERKRIADDLGVVLLVPAFVRPSVDWRILTHALDRDVMTTSRQDLARVDLQLLAMIDRARADLASRGISTDAKVLIQGFSASGMFSNRFTALHPDRVLAASSGSPGGWPLVPVAVVGADTLAYPAGVADLDGLTGQPFDSTAFRAVPQLFVQGSLDDNDSVDFRDGWDEEPAAQVDRLFGDEPQVRWARAEAIFAAERCNARFVTVPGVGHDRVALQGLTVDFFREILASRR